MKQFEIVRLGAERRLAGLRCLLAHPALPVDEVERQAADLLGQHERGWLSLKGLWGAFAPDDRIVSTCLVICHPGRSATLLMPLAVPRGRLLEQVVRQACQWAFDGDARFVQCQLEPGLRRQTTLLKRLRFRRLTRICSMVADVCAHCPQPVRRFEGNWTTYHPSLRDRFANVIERTYQGSLDCPQLNGLRTLDDILLAHQAEGYFDPRQWFLVERQGADVACLLLAQSFDNEALHLIYMGVCPEARGAGIGSHLVRRALAEANKKNLSQVHLCVDEKNRPARQIYRAFGFAVFGKRAVHLMLANDSNSYRQLMH